MIGAGSFDETRPIIGPSGIYSNEG